MRKTRIVPRVEWHAGIPQWIISSDIAAYHPYSSTIFIRAGRGRWRMFRSLLHELGHHVICLLDLPEVFHETLDHQ